MTLCNRYAHISALSCRWKEAQEDLEKALTLEAAQASEDGPSSILLNNLGDTLGLLEAAYCLHVKLVAYGHLMTASTPAVTAPTPAVTCCAKFDIIATFATGQWARKQLADGQNCDCCHVPMLICMHGGRQCRGRPGQLDSG